MQEHINRSITTEAAVIVLTQAEGIPIRIAISAKYARVLFVRTAAVNVWAAILSHAVDHGEIIMKKSAKTALGGIITALSVTLMLVSAVIPFLEYALPAIAGAILVIMVIELNKKWAFCTYVAVSILSILILANKETAMMYIAFFGYYPILKPFFESKIKNNIICWIVKDIEFNAAVVAAYFIIVKVFGMPLEELTENGLAGLLGILALGNVMFVLYDICITRLVTTYLIKWQKRFRKIFRS